MATQATSCLENPTDREAWQATVHGVTKKVRCNLAIKQIYINKIDNQQGPTV